MMCCGFVIKWFSNVDNWYSFRFVVWFIVLIRMVFCIGGVWFVMWVFSILVVIFLGGFVDGYWCVGVCCVGRYRVWCCWVWLFWLGLRLWWWFDCFVLSLWRVNFCVIGLWVWGFVCLSCCLFLGCYVWWRCLVLFNCLGYS